MSRNNLLNFIFKVVEKNSNKIIGTAFIMNNYYAITASHVLNNYNDSDWFLQNYDNKIQIKDCKKYCSLYNPKKLIDIYIIELKDRYDGFNDKIPISKNRVNIDDKYETYGYPRLNSGDELYISGKVISPEGRLDINNSAGLNDEGTELYDGTSGAPLIVNDNILGIISNEVLGNYVSKPELLSSNFSNILNYLENKEDITSEERKLLKFLNKYCKSDNLSSFLDPFYEEYDNYYSEIKDKKNITEKIESACPNFSNRVLSNWRRKSKLAEIELKRVSSKERKALLMAIFFPCIEYIEEKILDNENLKEDEIERSIEILKDKAIKFVNDRRKDYNYGLNNDTVIENTIFMLIDLCFLSFESYEGE